VKKKQLFGRTLDIIGLHVNPLNMIITMSESSRTELTTAIRKFVNTTENRRCPLVEWQQILGWINWALNVYPLVRPALQPAYSKIGGKQISRAPVFLNRDVIRNFNWLADTIESSDGIHVLDAIEWGASDANLTIFCDVSLTGLGFIVPSHQLGVTSPVSHDSKLSTIFYYEALAIASALLWASGVVPTICHLLIYTDSLNCMEMFNSLRALNGYNNILLFSVRILLSTKISLRVFHVPGSDNLVADALSRHLPSTAIALSPGLQVNLFQPPRITLGSQE